MPRQGEADDPAGHVAPDRERERGSTVPLILITGHGDVATAVDAIKQGAFDFIEKPLDDKKLMESVRRAAESGRQQRAQQDQLAEIRRRIAELSQRQKEVLDLVVKGRSNKEIALHLGISPRTVENYRAWVMEKMGATNLADLVRMVVQLTTTGWHPGEPDSPV